MARRAAVGEHGRISSHECTQCIREKDMNMRRPGNLEMAWIAGTMRPRRIMVRFGDAGMNCIQLSTTIVNSNRVHPRRRYARGCKIKPSATTLHTISAQPRHRQANCQYASSAVACSDTFCTASQNLHLLETKNENWKLKSIRSRRGKQTVDSLNTLT